MIQISTSLRANSADIKLSSSSSWRSSMGFTLTELMITLAVLAILLALAVPNFTTAVRRSEARSLSDDLLSSLTYSRQQAISTNQCVTICMVTNPQAAAPACRTTGDDWERGWLVFGNPLCDNNPNGLGAEILQIHNGVATGGATIAPNSTGANSRLIRFNPLGLVLLGEAKGFAVTARDSNVPQTNVCVARTGRITRNTQTPPNTCAL